MPRLDELRHARGWMNSDTLEAGCPSYDSGMNFEIRSISPKDAAEFWALRFEMLELEPFAYSADLEDHADSSISDQLRRLEGLTGGDCAVGAWFEGELVGAAVLRCEPGRKFSPSTNAATGHAIEHRRHEHPNRRPSPVRIARLSSLGLRTSSLAHRRCLCRRDVHGFEPAVRRNVTASSLWRGMKYPNHAPSCR
jgi:hypothetical protein